MSPPFCLPGEGCPGSYPRLSLSSGSCWGGGVVQFLPLVESYALGLVAAWLSSAASMALVVAGLPVVELVDVVEAMAVPVRVAMVSPLHQLDLDLFPMVSVLPQVSKVVYCLLRGWYHPVLGLASAQECHLVHLTRLSFCFSSPSWASLVWVLSWVLGFSHASHALEAVAVPVRVAMVSPLHQLDLDLFPMVSVLPQVSKVVYCLLRGWYHPVLGLASAQECHLVHLTRLSFCFSSPSWASLVWVLSWVLGFSHASHALEAVAVPVRVAMVSPLHQLDLDLFPMVSVLPQVSKVVYPHLRGRYHPVLGLALAQECHLVHLTRLSLCFSSPSWASLVWVLSWVLGFSHALSS